MRKARMTPVRHGRSILATPAIRVGALFNGPKHLSAFRNLHNPLQRRWCWKRFVFLLRWPNHRVLGVPGSTICPCDP